jgi:hypothetical protein
MYLYKTGDVSSDRVNHCGTSGGGAVTDDLVCCHWISLRDDANKMRQTLYVVQKNRMFGRQRQSPNDIK